jgi:8-oxo-dGTP pyrophosphatase MutT (NUDIX family)
LSKQTARSLAIEANVMNKPPRNRETVFTTPWFQILAEPASGGGQPHYLIQGTDFVVIVAVTPQDRILLVRQFRVPVAAVTLELPAGHVDPGETPEQAARRELLEETGYGADTFKLLATLSPSVARFTNRMWCFLAPNARPVAGAEAQREAGLELILYDRGADRGEGVLQRAGLRRFAFRGAARGTRDLN